MGQGRIFHLSLGYLAPSLLPQVALWNESASWRWFIALQSSHQYNGEISFVWMVQMWTNPQLLGVKGSVWLKKVDFSSCWKINSPASAVQTWVWTVQCLCPQRAFLLSSLDTEPPWASCFIWKKIPPFCKVVPSPFLSFHTWSQPWWSQW